MTIDVAYTVRPATRADSRFIYELSMDPRIREMSTRSDEFNFESHERWYEAKLTNGLNAIWIMEVGGLPVGQVRYGRAGVATAEISISISPRAWGHGYAAALLRETMDLAREHLAVRTLVALVLLGNERSRRLFEGLGFIVVTWEERMGKQHVRYEHVR